MNLFMKRLQIILSIFQRQALSKLYQNNEVEKYWNLLKIRQKRFQLSLE